MKNTMIALCVTFAVAAVAFAPVADAAVANQAVVPLEQKVGKNCQYTIGQDNATVITFAERWEAYQSNPYTEGVATFGVASGAFVGDYTESGMEALTFELATEGVTRKDVCVVLFSASGDRYYTAKLNCTTEDNVFLRTTVGFDLEADGWKGGTADQWAAALQNVGSIGMCVVQRGLQQQSYTIKGFSLVGPDGITIQGTLTPLQAALYNRFGVSSVADLGVMGAGDRDGDGLTDLEETLVGTDDTDSGSVVNVEVLDATDTGVEIKWGSAVEWATYKIYRTTDLAAGFPVDPVEELTLASPGVTAVDGESIWEDTGVDPDAGPYFYKVISVVNAPGEE